MNRPELIYYTVWFIIRKSSKHLQRFGLCVQQKCIYVYVGVIVIMDCIKQCRFLIYCISLSIYLFIYLFIFFFLFIICLPAVFIFYWGGLRK